ncbi:MAG: hypothetical protein IJJ33_15990 [Victivallales bacterium]|nr:hypothetical protein [Victivallales bacterium]
MKQKNWELQKKAGASLPRQENALQYEEVMAKLPTNRQDATSDEAIAPRREGGWDGSFAITS